MVAGKNWQLPAWLVDRILTMVERDSNGCLVWQGRVNENGYGRIAWCEAGETRHLYVHRAMWLAEKGPIPEGLELDHLCHNRPCCEVDHLEPVTPAENMRRALPAIRRGALKRVKTYCKRGHPLFGDNLYVVPVSGDRCCRECRRVEARERYRRNRRSAGHEIALGMGRPIVDRVGLS